MLADVQPLRLLFPPEAVDASFIHHTGATADEPDVIAGIGGNGQRGDPRQRGVCQHIGAPCAAVVAAHIKRGNYPLGIEAGEHRVGVVAKERVLLHNRAGISAQLAGLGQVVPRREETAHRVDVVFPHIGLASFNAHHDEHLGRFVNA